MFFLNIWQASVENFRLICSKFAKIASVCFCSHLQTKSNMKTLFWLMKNVILERLTLKTYSSKFRILTMDQSEIFRCKLTILSECGIRKIYRPTGNIHVVSNNNKIVHNVDHFIQLTATTNATPRWSWLQEFRHLPLVTITLY